MKKEEFEQICLEIQTVYQDMNASPTFADGINSALEIMSKYVEGEQLSVEHTETLPLNVRLQNIQKSKTYEIYTDGAYRPSADQGGWAYVVTQNNKIIRSNYDGDKNTTNNRMEIMGALQAVEWINKGGIPTGSTVVIYTDSQYVWGTVNKNWKRNKNPDLWAMWDTEWALCNAHQNISLEWVRGHADSHFNNIAYELAVRGSNLMLL